MGYPFGTPGEARSIPVLAYQIKGPLLGLGKLRTLILGRRLAITAITIQRTLSVAVEHRKRYHRLHITAGHQRIPSLFSRRRFRLGYPSSRLHARIIFPEVPASSWFRRSWLASCRLPIE